MNVIDQLIYRYHGLVHEQPHEQVWTSPKPSKFHNCLGALINFNQQKKVRSQTSLKLYPSDALLINSMIKLMFCCNPNFQSETF